MSVSRGQQEFDGPEGSITEPPISLSSADRCGLHTIDLSYLKTPESSTLDTPSVVHVDGTLCRERIVPADLSHAMLPPARR